MERPGAKFLEWAQRCIAGMLVFSKILPGDVSSFVLPRVRRWDCAHQAGERVGCLADQLGGFGRLSLSEEGSIFRMAETFRSDLSISGRCEKFSAILTML